MGIWVLDHETKGTGAHMVPLEKVLKRTDSPREPEPEFVFHKPRPREPEPPMPKPPARFKVVDVMSTQTLAEDADARATVDVLKGVRRAVDVRISRWDHEAERWRPLTVGERRAIWRLRER
jgi:hypothetical protein